jgi:uncharacterized protein
MKPDYLFIGKSLFFPEYGILAIGDLHLGYEYSLRQSGVLIPEHQIKEVVEDLKEIFNELKEKNLKLKKIVFIGDIKHSFGFESEEKNYFREVMDFLRQNLDEKNIIFIRGNHDTIDFSYGKMKDFYIWKDIAFIHGNEYFKEAFDKKIKTVVLGHIHPSVTLSDKQNIKREKYKCFLIGKFKNKEAIILPSFLNTIEGANVNDYVNSYEDNFSIIPKKTLLDFKVYAIGENPSKVYEFGKVRKLK